MSPGYPSYIADALDGQWQLERRRPHAVSDSDPAAVWFSPVVPPVHPDDVMVRYVIEYDLDVEHSILHVQPKSAIGRDDFVNLAKVVDPHRCDRRSCWPYRRSCGVSRMGQFCGDGQPVSVRARSSQAHKTDRRRDGLPLWRCRRAFHVTLRVRRDQAFPGWADRASTAMDHHWLVTR
jgi:hypothetical protein